MVVAELLRWGAPLGLCLANLLLAFNADIHQKEAREGSVFYAVHEPATIVIHSGRSVLLGRILRRYLEPQLPLYINPYYRLSSCRTTTLSSCSLAWDMSREPYVMNLACIQILSVQLRM